MRLRIIFVPEDGKNLVLPCHYNEIVQGFIYRHLDSFLAKRIHDQGFGDPDAKRRFRFFTFSRLIPSGSVSVKNGRIYLDGPVSLVVASPINAFVESFAENVLKSGIIWLNGKRLAVSSVGVEAQPSYNENILVRTLSPVTVYSTVTLADCSKKTYFYSPFESDFGDLIIKNLQRKLKVLTGHFVEGGSIKPYIVKSGNQRIVKYKGTVIKGWDGIFELSLPEELFRLAFDAGIGAKNSQGFGCVEVWR